MIDTQTITWRDAKNAIDDLVSQSYEESPEWDTRNADIAIYAVNSNLQFRDYFLGLPKTAPLVNLCELVVYLGERAETADTSIPFMTIASAYLHELGEVEMANKGINTVLEGSEYPLARLLRRLFDSNMPFTWQEMRDDLHEKVVQVIVDNLDNAVTDSH